MTSLLLGIGELDATRTQGVSLKTLALGSCVALVMLDPRSRSVGLAHVALPDSTIDAARAQDLPGYFADTAVKALLARMAALGADAGGRGLLVKLAGGANVLASHNTFGIGKRNVLAIKKSLWRFGLGPQAEDVGGDWSRTVEVFVESGLLLISSPGRPPLEI